MKVEIKKYEPYRKGAWLYKLYYRIYYKPKDMVREKLDIEAEDMEEFMDKINEKWGKILTKKLNKLCKSVIEENKNEVS